MFPRLGQASAVHLHLPLMDLTVKAHAVLVWEQASVQDGRAA